MTQNGARISTLDFHFHFVSDFLIQTPQSRHPTYIFIKLTLVPDFFRSTVKKQKRLWSPIYRKCLLLLSIRSAAKFEKVSSTVVHTSDIYTSAPESFNFAPDFLQHSQEVISTGQLIWGHCRHRQHACVQTWVNTEQVY